MFPSNAGYLLSLVLIMGGSACVSRPVISVSATSTSMPATATQTATRQPPTLTPTPTIFVPPLPDDKRILASIDVGNAPWNMAVGNGSLWVIAGATIVRIDPATNSVIADITLPWEPHRVAFGEEAVWVGNWHDLSVSRIDPQTNQIVGMPIDIGYVAGNLAAGFGSVWVTSDYRGVQAFPEPYPDHTVLIRIDPKTDKVVDTIPLGGTRWMSK